MAVSISRWSIASCHLRCRSVVSSTFGGGFRFGLDLVVAVAHERVRMYWGQCVRASTLAVAYPVPEG